MMMMTMMVVVIMMIRDPERHKGRHCLYPEVPRTFHNGVKGNLLQLLLLLLLLLPLPPPPVL